MVQGVYGELRLFLISILTGMILFGVYDIGKAFRQAIRHRVGWVAAEDLLYWIFAALFLFYIFCAYNEGVLRSYVVLGSIAGMAIYWSFFRKLFYWPFFQMFRGAAALLRCIKNILHKGKKFIVKNVIFPLKKTLKTFTIILRHF